MSNPIYLMSVFSWYGDHDPGSSETTQSGTISQYDNYTNINTGKTWINIDPTVDAMVWGASGNVVYSGSRSVNVSSPAFNSVRTPNASAATWVTASINSITTALNSNTIKAQVNTNDGNGYIDEATYIQSSLIDNRTIPMSFFVPSGASYKIIDTGSTGTRSITLLKEASL